MKRIVWIAVAILIMLGIMGYGLHTLNSITEVNKRRHEKEQGEQLASQFAISTTTISIWERLKQTTAPQDNPPQENPGGDAPTQPSPDDEVSTTPAPQEPGDPEVIADPPAQTSTVTTGLVVHVE